MNTAQREVRQVMAQLREMECEETFAILPSMLPNDAAAEVYGRRFHIDKKSPTLWIYRSLHRKEHPPICKVQRKIEDRVVGGCSSFFKNRPNACGHVAHYCHENGLPVVGPYLLATRLEPYSIYYPDEQPKQLTRRNHAGEDLDPAVRTAFYQLCVGLEDPRPKLTKSKKVSNSNAGQPPAPYRALLYLRLLKAFKGGNFHCVREDALNDRNDYFAMLGGIREKVNRDGSIEPYRHEAFGEDTFTKFCADPYALEDLREILARTAEPGRFADRVLGIDVSGFGTTKLAVWFLAKYGQGAPKDPNDESDPNAQTPDNASNDAHTPSEPVEAKPKLGREPKKKRNKRSGVPSKKGFIKVHALVGMTTGLIRSIACTLSYGQGTADSRQFRHLIENGVERFFPGDPRVIVADKAYWNDEHFGYIQKLGLLLMVLSKEGTDPANAELGRELMAFVEYLRTEHPGVYRTFYRYRQKIEGIFSAAKRTMKHILTRARKRELARLQQQYPPELKGGPKGYEDLRRRVCEAMATELVPIAQIADAYAIAIAYNVRRLVELQNLHNQPVNFSMRTGFTPFFRAIIPRGAQE